MKFTTAVARLEGMAQVATERLRLRDTDIGWPLEELWVAGELLDGPETLKAGSVVLVLDVPAGELPWLALHPAGEWVGSELRLGKLPFRWCYRPAMWPAWNPEHRRVARFWSAKGGLDETVVETLRRRHVDRLPVVEPSVPQLTEQLETELDVSRRHLREVLDHYWDRDWRRAHKRFDESPEDDLWRAARGVVEIEDALATLRT